MRFDRRFCPLAVGAALLVAGAGLALAILVGWALRDVLPPEPLVVVQLVFMFLLWYLLPLAAAVGIFAALRRREAARRQKWFEGRLALTDEAFGRLFPEAVAATAADVRGELERFVGQAEVIARLLPTDPVRSTCNLAGVYLDDLDWMEFLITMEERFGVRLLSAEDHDATVAELVAWCAAAAKHTEPPARADSALKTGRGF